jgi:MFS family permease
MNLCLPYASVYMLALGLKDTQVGLIATTYMLSQVFFAFFSGPIIDKIGRRLSTAGWDAVAWCVPCLIWWRAENFWFFFVAALINGTMKITHNSWNCLLVEDAEKTQITHIYSLVIVSGQLCAFFAPIASILVSRFTLVPAVRILYVNAFILMTVKVVVLFLTSRETGIGLVRLRESRGKSILELTAGYRGVIKIIFSSRGTVFAMLLCFLFGVVAMLNSTFWQVIASKRILVPDPLLPLFPVIKSILSIFFLFFVMPRVSGDNLKAPLLVGFACFFLGQALLISVPSEGEVRYVLLCVSLIFDGFGFGALAMLTESLLALNIDPDERARIMAILLVITMAATAPFGWIGGMLSDISRALPFVLNLCLLGAGALITLIFYTINPLQGRKQGATPS